MIVMVQWTDMGKEDLVDSDEDSRVALIPMILVIFFLLFLVEDLVDNHLVLVRELILVMILKLDSVFHWKMPYWVEAEK